MRPLSSTLCRFLLICIVALIGATSTRFVHATDNNSTLTLLVVPQFPATEINATWGKLLPELETEKLPKIELIFAKDIREFETLFLTGRADLIYCNPYHMVMAKKAQGYISLVRDSKPLTGILIATKSSDSDSIETLNDLKGKTLLFPSPNAFGASLYMRALLTREKGIEFTTKYVKTHSNVIRGVVRNEGQAGGMVSATLAAETNELKNKVRVIYETPPAPPHPIAAHPRVDAATREALTKAIISHIEQNRQLGADIQMANPIRANYTKDYHPLEKLGLEAFVVN
jgi:phosphonate transport system substrate-binding protein